MALSQRVDCLFPVLLEKASKRCASSGRMAVRAAAQTVARQRSRLSHGLHAQALGDLYPLLDEGRISLSNNAPERTLRDIALGRKSWLFAGSDRGGQRASAMYGLIVNAKLNNVDPPAWLADALARIADHPAHGIDRQLPRN
jgi:hypothetical protein